MADRNGAHSVKSAYKVLSAAATTSSQREVCLELPPIWKARVSFKAKTVTWRIFKGRLPTCDNLLRRQVPLSASDVLCTACEEENESVEHFFFVCKRSCELWDAILLWIGKYTALHHKASEHFATFSNIGD
ncbi:uncharacterized protein LOC131021117 [Salvia miltiorrhiza]|uniref:uncharacterized protein LOC131021117 n=1 Tax=Salvia miltiorrhiza TaxID=226208 RepID=UPI0025AC5D76|nr:uncharacterized protein LOC131021117 [Salvia miltiorrhiza]